MHAPLPTPTAKHLPIGRIAAVAAASLALGGGVGSAAGFLTNNASGPSTDGWEDLGGAIFALAVGFVVGAVAYLVALVIGVRWAVPPGRRLAVFAAVVGARNRTGRRPYSSGGGSSMSTKPSLKTS